MSRRLLVPLALTLSLVLGLLGAVLARSRCSSDVAVLDRWFAETAAAVQGAPDVQASRTWALAWEAAADALAPRSGPDDAPLPDLPGRAGDRVAGAVSTVLAELVPARDAAVATALRDGCSGDDGVRSGRAAARLVLDDAVGDGLAPDRVDPPVSSSGPPPPGTPGRWRPTPPDYAPQGGTGLVRARTSVPLAELLKELPAPAPLGSDRYRRDLDEVRRLGAVDSVERTTAQTATAQFWAASSVATYTDVLRELVPTLGLRDGVRLLARFHRTALEVQIAVGAAKATHPRWRPVTALRDDDDGDPATPKVPGWSPLVVTPPNPEYPSGHATYAAAAAVVLSEEVGNRSVQVRGRRWSTWEQLVNENVDARVWAGLHLRSSDEAGAALGRRIALLVRGS